MPATQCASARYANRPSQAPFARAWVHTTVSPHLCLLLHHQQLRGRKLHRLRRPLRQPWPPAGIAPASSLPRPCPGSQDGSGLHQSEAPRLQARPHQARRRDDARDGFMGMCGVKYVSHRHQDEARGPTKQQTHVRRMGFATSASPRLSRPSKHQRFFELTNCQYPSFYPNLGGTTPKWYGASSARARYIQYTVNRRAAGTSTRASRSRMFCTAVCIHATDIRSRHPRSA